MAPTTHTDKAYEAELRAIRDRLLEMGGLVEFGPTPQIFTAPKDERTEAYITGRFG